MLNQNIMVSLSSGIKPIVCEFEFFKIKLECYKYFARRVLSSGVTL